MEMILVGVSVVSYICSVFFFYAAMMWVVEPGTSEIKVWAAASVWPLWAPALFLLCMIALACEKIKRWKS